MKLILFASIAIIFISLSACSKINEEKSSTKTGSKAQLRDRNKLYKPFHGDMETSSSKVSDSPVLESLKKNHLEVSSTKTIGEAFENYKYSSKKEWRETAAVYGPYFIDYICWIDISPVSPVALREGIVKRALDIKFTVRDGGETYIAMVSRIDIKSDGMVHTTVIEPAEIKKIVTAIYENREIAF